MEKKASVSKILPLNENSFNTYCLHIHSLLQLYHHVIDAILQERPSIANNQL
jgi:hypothetical protein